MATKTWPSLIKVLRITKGSWNWSSDMAFSESIGHECCPSELPVGHPYLTWSYHHVVGLGLIPTTSTCGSAQTCLSYSMPSPLLRAIYPSTQEEEGGISAFCLASQIPIFFQGRYPTDCSTVKLSNPFKGKPSFGVSSGLWTAYTTVFCHKYMLSLSCYLTSTVQFSLASTPTSVWGRLSLCLLQLLEILPSGV